MYNRRKIAAENHFLCSLYLRFNYRRKKILTTDWVILSAIAHCKDDKDLVSIVDVLDLAYVKKGRGIPKKSWLESIRNDLSLLDVKENLTLNMTK
ncbi:hypothetical protein IEQ34_010391 [Dendrobium chrysotoxum]|uniref:Uncharacterized protein n=1 Tax=Dendrobium chrysotoxum TaxID=161865 RepID=A0AAV7H2Z0_DENCH|nr:hypothetical protein IEQ34_010391 [Dendrobium chrysotoxum]